MYPMKWLNENIYFSGGHGKESEKEIEFLDRYLGRWQHGPDNEDEAKKKLARVRSCMVILKELNMIDIGGWDQAQTLGKFDEVKGVWTYTNNTMLHNDRYL